MWGQCLLCQVFPFPTVSTNPPASPSKGWKLLIEWPLFTKYKLIWKGRTILNQHAGWFEKHYLLCIYLKHIQNTSACTYFTWGSLVSCQFKFFWMFIRSCLFSWESKLLAFFPFFPLFFFCFFSPSFFFSFSFLSSLMVTLLLTTFMLWQQLQMLRTHRHSRQHLLRGGQRHDAGVWWISRCHAELQRQREKLAQRSSRPARCPALVTALLQPGFPTFHVLGEGCFTALKEDVVSLTMCTKILLENFLPICLLVQQNRFSPTPRIECMCCVIDSRSD